MQVFLSNFTFTSIMEALYLNDKFVFNIDKPFIQNSTFNFDTSLIGIFVPKMT